MTTNRLLSLLYITYLLIRPTKDPRWIISIMDPRNNQIDCSSGDETMSGESDTFETVKDDLSEESDTFEPVQDDLSGERLFRQLRDRMLSGESDSRQPRDRVLSGESRNISDNLEYGVGESVGSSVDSRPQSWDNTSETTSNSDISEIATHSLMVDWKQRRLD